MNKPYNKSWTELLLSAAGLGGFILIWELSGRAGLLPGTLIPLPSQVPQALAREMALPGIGLPGGLWMAKVLQSLGHYLRGVLGGIGAGVILGLTAGSLPKLAALLQGLVRLLRPIPPLAWIPFAIIWFGITPAASAFIIFVGVFWINFLSTLGTVQHSNPDFREVAHVFGFGRFLPRLLHVTIPESLPGMLTGIRTSLGMGWMAVVASELFGIPGIGERMNQAAGLLATDIVLVYMLTIAGLYTLFDSAFSLIQRRLTRWLPKE
ncbi:ABC transporter permease [Spirochaeta lutea]|uniref:ABC transporter permease n=1 Tax=Spirochaeta lutea TaxID=1480694 RepID=UPI0006898CFB|nr:ABC transporter permease [Spirochaeta lutea]